MATYCTAPELHQLIRDLIGEYHKHLIDADIAIMWRTDTWVKDGNCRSGKAIITPELWRELTGYDLAIIVNKEYYSNITAKKQMALLDNLLSYFGVPTKNSYKMNEPDVQEFSAVLERWKICFSAYDRLDGSVEKAEYVPCKQEDEDEIYEVASVEGDEEDDNLLTVELYEDIDDSDAKVTPLLTFK